MILFVVTTIAEGGRWCLTSHAHPVTRSPGPLGSTMGATDSKAPVQSPEEVTGKTSSKGLPSSEGTVPANTDKRFAFR
jgi:hypothetical protein